MMLGGELKVRQARLVKEQAERIEKARRKTEAERHVKERQQRRIQDEEEQARSKRLEEQRKIELDAAIREADLEHNNGVYYAEVLQPVPADSAAALATGVKRSADKISLPPAAGALLMEQDAPRNGAMFFELSSRGGGTHAGVLDFSASAGTVVLPRKKYPSHNGCKVAQSLWGLDTQAGQMLAPVTVKYRRLQKGTYVRFQPRTADFQRQVGDAVGEVLTAALFKHSVLTEGDWIQVHVGDASYDLRVLELRPERAVSVIDTEMEAEIEPSMETAERLAAEAAASARREAQLDRIREERASAEAAERTLAAGQVAAAESAAADREQRRQALEAALPPEPDARASVPTSACAVRLPDGRRVARRFLRSAPLQQLFDFIDAKGGGGLDPGRYQLVAQYPRRVLLPTARDSSLEAAGIVASQETLMLEPWEQ